MQLFSQNQIESLQSQNYMKYCAILQSYCHMNEDYNRISQENEKIRHMILEVEEKTSQIQLLINKENIQRSKVLDVIHIKIFGNETNKLEKQESQNKFDISLQMNSEKKRIRKPSQRRFKCPYEQCGRLYDTSVSLNLHMKLKHNAGTKKQRQILADSILSAIQKGQDAPMAQIELPPQYLQQYQVKKLFKQKYSM